MPHNQPMGPVQTLIYCVVFVVWIGAVHGSGCQHQCNCGFSWTGDDTEENTTLRYEVMGGLIGAFSPLFLAGIGYFIYRKCNCNGTGSAPGGRKGMNSPWRERTWTSGGKISPTGGGFDRPRGSTPISLYGEIDDSFLTGNSSLPNKFNSPQQVPGGAMPMPADTGPLTSQYKNVHRNFSGNEINQWFKNVNTAKY